VHDVSGERLLRPCGRVRPEELPEERLLETDAEEQGRGGLRVGVGAQPPEALFGAQVRRHGLVRLVRAGPLIWNRKATMKILVVGATGKTGREVMTQALSQGHSVVALARRPEAITLQHARLAVVKGDVLDAHSLGPACDGVDAVISALGIGASRAPTRVYSDGIRHILTAMQAAGTGRIVVVSAEPAGPWAPHTLPRRVVLFPILQRLFGATYDDMRRMETILRDSAAQWTVLRPPRLLDKPARERPYIVRTIDHRLHVTHADLEWTDGEIAALHGLDTA